VKAHANDNAATIWVCTLGPHQVTRPQKNVLLRIAAHWADRWGIALVPNAALCDELQYCARQLGRIIKDLSDAGLIVYSPGKGSGNYSQFRFPQMPVENPVNIGKKGNVNPTETRQKPDIFDNTIKEENKNLIQSQNLIREVGKKRSPISQKDFDERDLRLMGQALRKMMEREPDHRPLIECLTEEEALRYRCEFAGITRERGRALLGKALDWPRKPLQSDIAV
jgi:hypothetical protein